MFDEIPFPVLERMRQLEKIDTQDRIDGTPRMERLRQIPPETGKFIALMAAVAPEGKYIEIGTSAGYSTLWIALACRLLNRTLRTYEILDDKAELARQTFEVSAVSDVVELIHGDALDHLSSQKGISFCFLDAEKEVYDQCYDAVIPNMVPGGILIADNAINHEKTLRPMLDKALEDPRTDALIVPIGKGELVCRVK